MAKPKIQTKDRHMIRTMYKYKFSIWDIKEKFSIDYSTVRRIVLKIHPYND